MTIQVLITDDSALARKQMARTLPETLDAEVTFAENGQMALEQLKSGSFDVMFLDLTMPVLDGYQTLEAMKQQNIVLPVFVVSGDIQPRAQERVLSLGAKAFLKKPVSKELLEETLANTTFGGSSSPSDGQESESTHIAPTIQLSRRDIYLEVVNVAMGRAADSMARYFDVFVHMPLPQVNVFEVSELDMTIRHLAASDSMSGICQGFSGEGIAGEALMLVSDSSLKDLMKILDYPDDGTMDNELELLVDVSNVLISAFLSGIGEQAGLAFAQSYPSIIGQHMDVDSLVSAMHGAWKRTVTIEISYALGETDIKCDLLLLLVDASLSTSTEN